jgi:hypothetical protein
MTKISQAKKFYSPPSLEARAKVYLKSIKFPISLSLSLLSPHPRWAWLGAIGSMHVVINEERGRGNFSPF